MDKAFALAYLDSLVVHRLADPSVWSAQSAPRTKHVAIRNVEILAQELVVSVLGAK